MVARRLPVANGSVEESRMAVKGRGCHAWIETQGQEDRNQDLRCGVKVGAIWMEPKMLWTAKRKTLSLAHSRPKDRYERT